VRPRNRALSDCYLKRTPWLPTQGLAAEASALSDALAALERRWQELGAPTGHLLADPLPADEISGQLGHVGGGPSLAIAWFGWHNGPRVADWRPVPSTLPLLSLADSLAERSRASTVVSHYEDANQGEPGGAFVYWSDSWLPLFADGRGRSLGIDLANGHLMYGRYVDVPLLQQVLSDQQLTLSTWITAVVLGEWLAPWSSSEYAWINDQWQSNETDQTGHLVAEGALA
jgi:hypothetical protein